MKLGRDEEKRDESGKFTSGGGGGGGGGAGPAGHEQLHKKLTESGHKYSETDTHHIWFNPKAGSQTMISKKGAPTNKEPGAKPKPYYRKPSYDSAYDSAALADIPGTPEHFRKHGTNVAMPPSYYREKAARR